MVCDSTSPPRVSQYSEAVLVTHVTILQCTYRFVNQTAILHCGLKKEPLKKCLTRAVRSGRTPKFIKT